MNKKVLIFGIGSLLVLTTVIVLLTLYPDYRTKSSAQNLVKYLIDGNYDKAFNYISYFDTYSDIESDMPKDIARDFWVSRSSGIDKLGYRLVSYDKNNLTISNNDSCRTVYITNFLVDHNGIRETYDLEIANSLCDPLGYSKFNYIRFLDQYGRENMELSVFSGDIRGVTTSEENSAPEIDESRVP